MKSVDVNLGDWLQHTLLLKGPSRSQHKARAEVAIIQITGVVYVYYDDEPGYKVIQVSEFKNWEPFYPPDSMLSEPAPPSEIRRGAEFVVYDYHATVSVVRGSWISYFEQGPNVDKVLRIRSYNDFLEMGWRPYVSRSIWYWIRNPVVSADDD